MTQPEVLPVAAKPDGAISGDIVQTPDVIGARLAAPIALLAEGVDALVTQAKQPVTRDNLEASNALYTELAGLEKRIEKAHEAAKKPITTIGRIVDAAKKAPVDALAEARKALGGAIAKITRELQMEREAAEAEVRRLHEEAAAAAAKAEAERLAALAKPDLTDDEVAALAAPVAVVPPPPEPLPELPKSAVTTRIVYKVVIDDPDAVPAKVGAFELRPINTAELKRALDAGFRVAGARLVAEEVASARAVR